MSTGAPDTLPAANTAKPPQAKYKTWGLIVAALVLLAWGGHWLYQRATHVYFDDARIDGEVITLSSRVSGWITELPVIEGDEVKSGQLLARIDSRDAVLRREMLVSMRTGNTAQIHRVTAPGARTSCL